MSGAWLLALVPGVLALGDWCLVLGVGFWLWILVLGVGFVFLLMALGVR